MPHADLHGRRPGRRERRSRQRRPGGAAGGAAGASRRCGRRSRRSQPERQVGAAGTAARRPLELRPLRAHGAGPLHLRSPDRHPTLRRRRGRVRRGHGDRRHARRRLVLSTTDYTPNGSPHELIFPGFGDFRVGWAELAGHAGSGAAGRQRGDRQAGPDASSGQGRQDAVHRTTATSPAGC